MPLAAALPSLCGEDCTIASDSNGYRPPFTTIASGSSVVWTSSDYTHITVDGRGLGDQDPCFWAIHDAGEPSLAVTFDVVDGVLYATQDGVTNQCANVVATPAGVAMPYFCVLHPTMRGSLVVHA